MERLVFGYGSSTRRGTAPGLAPSRSAATAAPSHRRNTGDTQGPSHRRNTADTQAGPAAEPRERRDWAFTGLLAFTAVLYFRPQDQVPGLSAVPFADITAIFALGAMVFGRMSRGLGVTRVTPELMAVVALGFVMLLTAPFSIWPGGAIGTFTGLFAKVILIYALMVNTVTTPARVHRFTWVLVIVSGYIATRAVFDYARGFNLIENDRVQGAVGGMFKNPNDLALAMVAVLPLTALVAVRAKTTAARLGAWFFALMMIGAVMASHSRGGFIGLVLMGVVLAVQLAGRRPRMLAAGAVLLLFVAPFAPASYWERVSSITDESLDATGSREARRTLLREAWNTFLAFPAHGVGAGQFQNYNPPARVETWRETHNVVLQVAAELGGLGLLVFGFLLWRAFASGRTTRKLLRRASDSSPPRWPSQTSPAPPPSPAVVPPEMAEYFYAHAGAMTAAIAGWFVCALFASVAYSWTFYYLLALAVAPHGILRERLAARRAAKPVPIAQPVEARI